MAFPDTGNPGKEASLIDEINRLRLVLKEQCRENNAYDIIRNQAFSLSSLPFKPPRWISKKNPQKIKKAKIKLVDVKNRCPGKNTNGTI